LKAWVRAALSRASTIAGKQPPRAALPLSAARANCASTAGGGRCASGARPRTAGRGAAAPRGGCERKRRDREGHAPAPVRRSTGPTPTDSRNRPLSARAGAPRGSPIAEGGILPPARAIPACARSGGPRRANARISSRRTAGSKPPAARSGNAAFAAGGRRGCGGESAEGYSTNSCVVYTGQGRRNSRGIPAEGRAFSA
jgi:hypothetical protein